MERINLFSSIQFKIELADYDRVLNDNNKLKIATSLYNFINKAITKYIKGQKEHGGDITEKDLRKEINQEIIDLFWYSEAEVWKEMYEAVKRKNTNKKHKHHY